MTNRFAPLEYASIEFTQEGVPFSALFNDVYFSKGSGIDETRHVFIDGNDLTTRFKALDAKESGQFTIIETGFGSGLNFLVTWQLWQQYAPSHWQLHYLSVEKYPMKRDDLVKCCQVWPELEEFSQKLIASYPVLTPGFHRIVLSNSVSLTLMLGDASEMLKQLMVTDAPVLAQQIRSWTVDAWFLDGFSPKKNTDLWQPSLFKQMALLSDENTTLATYTVSGLVKQGLRAAGFNLAKRTGFGCKRQMLTAKYFGVHEVVNQFRYASPHATPWHQVSVQKKRCHQKAIVVGAGIAGCQIAYALAKRGWQVTVLEKNKAIASEGSGNEQGVLFTKLSPHHSPLSDFVVDSYLYACQFYQSLHLGQEVARFDGMLQLAYNDKEAGLQQALKPLLSHYPSLASVIDKKQASQLAAIELLDSALYWPQSGWIKPTALCRRLLDHENIELITSVNVGELYQQEGEWRCSSGHKAPVVVMATGTGTQQLAQLSHLPVKAIKGQVTKWLGNEVSESLRIPVCSDGYLLPRDKGGHYIGATYNLGKNLHRSVADNDLDNLTKLKHFNLLDDINTISQQVIFSRCSYRVTTPDYLPIVGPAPVVKAMQQEFAYLKKNANAFINQAGHYHPNLYVATGYGSRGLTSSPLCSEYLASVINNEPLPVNQLTVRNLSPARFIIRDIIRGG